MGLSSSCVQFRTHTDSEINIEETKNPNISTFIKDVSNGSLWNYITNVNT